MTTPTITTSGQIAIRSNAVSKIEAEQLDYFLLDGSISMEDKWWDILGALDAYVATLRTNHVDAHCVLQIFCTHERDYIARDCRLKDWQDFATSPVGAYWGSTPLYDGILLAVKRIRELNPTKGCHLVIATDGQENASQYCDEVQARALLDWLRDQGFQVTFIGCDFNNSSQARALGANDATSIGVQKKLLTAAMKNLGEKRTRYARTGSNVEFSDDEKQQFGGHLADHRKDK